MKMKLSALLTVKAQANDAVDSALQLLRDLVEQEHDEQTRHDAQHEEEVSTGLARISNLKDVEDSIRGQCDNGHAHLQFIDDEITDTNNHISWIDARVETLTTPREELAAGRCESNAIFVQTLREHTDALAIIEWLRTDLNNWNVAANTELLQVNNIADKLKLYSHLFNEQALNEFLQLGEPQTWGELTDQVTRRDDDHAESDNSRGELSLEAGPDGGRDTKGTVVGRILALLDKLEAHLRDSLANLEANEIRAAFDLADWLDHAEDEENGLAADRDRKTRYLEKLGLDREVAQNYVNDCESRYDDAVSARHAAEDDLQAKNDWYASETARRNDELDLLAECIEIFEERIASMKDYLRNRIESYENTQGFDTSLRGVEI